MNALIYSSSVVAAFLGGILALFAPCCIVSLMPAYLAAALRRGGWQLATMTLLFSAGVALVLLPIVLGIGALSQTFGQYHREVYFVVGLLLTLLGVFALSGRGWLLPLPMLSTPARAGQGDAGGVLLLGVISGLASSCCAPVLVGVLALTALSPSTLTAAGLGLAYVFGMVFPLLLAAALWERLGLDQHTLTRLGARRLAFGAWSAKVTDTVAGLMFVAMGTLALYLAFTGQSTYTPDFLLVFNHWASSILADVALRLQGVPAVLQGAGLLLIAIAVVWLAWRRPAQRLAAVPPGEAGTPAASDTTAEDDGDRVAASGMR
ncbi:MAG: cytochrome c biogenesis protein CcdA [Chloroflexi bacterium]|nr:cytochrome c biogenesis protein CcdA [Chloroflexota bacterium]